MRVRDRMRKTVLTVNTGDSTQDAGRLLKEHGIHMLPVLNNGRQGDLLKRKP